MYSTNIMYTGVQKAYYQSSWQLKMTQIKNECMCNTEESLLTKFKMNLVRYIHVPTQDKLQLSSLFSLPLSLPHSLSPSHPLSFPPSPLSLSFTPAEVSVSQSSELIFNTLAVLNNLTYHCTDGLSVLDEYQQKITLRECVCVCVCVYVCVCVPVCTYTCQFPVINHSPSTVV